MALMAARRFRPFSRPIISISADFDTRPLAFGQRFLNSLAQVTFWVARLPKSFLTGDGAIDDCLLLDCCR
jgi:hypothetical protein